MSGNKSLTRVLAVAVVLAAAAGLWKLTHLDSNQAPAVAAAPDAPTAPEQRVRRLGTVGGEALSPEARARAEAATRAAGAAGENGLPVVLTAADTVATVNGKEIRGSDLLAFGGKTQIEMSRTSFDDMTRRAIERELISQAARKDGVELTPAQNGQLNSARRNTMEQREIRDPAAIAVEMREIESELLQTSLLEKHGGVRSVPTPEDVERYYREHRAEFGNPPGGNLADGLKAVQGSIREHLANDMQQKYKDALRRYLDELAASAKISRNL